MMRRLISMLCVTVLVVSMSTGCSWTQKGAAIGGVSGAAIGGPWANSAGNLSAAEGAFVGLAAGGLAGALIGDLLDQRNMKEMEAELQAKQDELDARNALLNKAKADLEKANSDLEEREARIRELENQIKELEKELAKLRDELKELKGVGAVREGDEIIITILGETLYESGKAELTANGKNVLDEIMPVVRKHFPDRQLMVRGHTDSEPIKESGWKSNWELGAARSLGVLHYLMDKHGIKGENISAATYSYYQARASNSSADGRRLNRRAEIVILPAKKIKLERYQ